MIDQIKIGEFLRDLRKEKELTQEQLAEKFGVSSRSVSRWENGNTMPELGILVELADYYEVDIKEIIDGERKSEIMEKEEKETLRKVADYVEAEKKLVVKRICIVTFVGILAFVLLYQVYLYFVPKIQVVESVAQSENFHMELPLVIFEKESVFGVRKNVLEQVEEFTNEIALFEMELGTEYSKPMDIYCEITPNGRQVKVTFSGTVTSNDEEKIIINKEFYFDKY